MLADCPRPPGRLIGAPVQEPPHPGVRQRVLRLRQDRINRIPVARCSGVDTTPGQHWVRCPPVAYPLGYAHRAACPRDEAHGQLRELDEGAVLGSPPLQDDGPFPVSSKKIASSARATLNAMTRPSRTSRLNALCLSERFRMIRRASLSRSSMTAIRCGPAHRCDVCDWRGRLVEVDKQQGLLRHSGRVQARLRTCQAHLQLHDGNDWADAIWHVTTRLVTQQAARRDPARPVGDPNVPASVCPARGTNDQALAFENRREEPALENAVSTDVATGTLPHHLGHQ